MDDSLHAFYDLGDFGECPHANARLECDFAVTGEPWYVACPDCGGAADPGPDEGVAWANWSELVELADVLAYYNANCAARGPGATPHAELVEAVP